MRADYLDWAGVIALVFIAALFLGIILTQVDGWYDDWRAYAHTSQFGGACSDPDPVTRPSECDDSPPFETWMFVPWLMSVGGAVALLAVVFPKGYTLPRRRRRDG